MLINFDNTGYIKVCEHTNLPVEDKYIPASTWGFIRGDISEQKDLMELLTTIESGLTPEQIELIVDVDDKLNDVESKIVELNSDIDASLLLVNQSIISLETADIKINKDIEELEFRVNEDLILKADADKVYTKTEIDGKGYATESWVYSKGYLSVETDPVWSAEKHKYALKTDLPSVAGYASESWVDERLLSKANISDVYTKTEIDNKGYLTQHQSLDNYYTKTEVDTAISNVEVDLTGYATETYVNTAISTKVDTNQIWTGTQSEWDALSTEQQNSYIIAMIEL